MFDQSEISTEKLDEVARRADDIVYETEFSDKQALVLAADEDDLEDEDIARLFEHVDVMPRGRTESDVREVRNELAEIRRELPDRIERLELMQKYLEDGD